MGFIRGPDGNFWIKIFPCPSEVYMVTLKKLDMVEFFLFMIFLGKFDANERSIKKNDIEIIEVPYFDPPKMTPGSTKWSKSEICCW